MIHRGTDDRRVEASGSRFPVEEVIRKARISEQTFCGWKAKYAGLEVDQLRRPFINFA
jgi:hypothetical protein